MQVVISRADLAGLFATLKADAAHPPLSYLVTWALQKVGGGEPALRGASVAASVAAALCVFLRAGAFARPAAALGAAGAFLVLPASVHYGQEVRPYALALALVAGADLALDATRRGRRGAGAAFAVLATASVATLYLAAFPLVAIGLDELLRARREKRRPAPALFAGGASAGVFLGAWLAWIGPRPPSPVSPGSFLARVPGLLAGLATFREESVAWPFAALAVWAAVLLGTAAAGGERRRLVLLLVASLGGPALLLAGAHWFVALRYFLFALLPMAFGAGEALARVRPGLLRAAAAFLALGSLARPAAAVVREGRPDWRAVARALEDARAQGAGGEIFAADGWSYWELSAQWPRGPAVHLADQVADLLAVATSRGPLWIVRTPHHPAPAEIDARLSSPWWRAAPAEDALVFRFEGGAPVPPGSFRWRGPGADVFFPEGGGTATEASLRTLQRDARAVLAAEPHTDGAVSAAVRITDELGSAFNWVGLAARRPPAGGGVLGLVRSNGEAVLRWNGGETKGPSGADPRRGVRLTLACDGPRCAFSVDGREVLSAETGPPAAGAWGLEARALVRATRLEASPENPSHQVR